MLKDSDPLEWGRTLRCAHTEARRADDGFARAQATTKHARGARRRRITPPDGTPERGKRGLSAPARAATASEDSESECSARPPGAVPNARMRWPRVPQVGQIPQCGLPA